MPSTFQKVETNKSDLERLANRAAGYMVETIRLFRDHKPEDFPVLERKEIENIVKRFQKFVHVRCPWTVSDAILLIRTMTKVITYARSKSQITSTALDKMKYRAEQLFHASDERKQIDKLTKELEDILSLVSVSTYCIQQDITIKSAWCESQVKADFKTLLASTGAVVRCI